MPSLFAASSTVGGVDGGPNAGYVGGLIKATVALRAAKRLRRPGRRLRGDVTKRPVVLRRSVFRDHGTGAEAVVEAQFDQMDMLSDLHVFVEAGDQPSEAGEV
jgi:hypothetical protein